MGEVQTESFFIKIQGNQTFQLISKIMKTCCKISSSDGRYKDQKTTGLGLVFTMRSAPCATKPCARLCAGVIGSKWVIP